MATKIERLFAKLEEIEAYHRSLGKLHFDMTCTAPAEGLAQAGKDQAILGQQLFKLTHDKEYEQLICDLNGDRTGLNEAQNCLVDRLYERYSKTKNHTAEFSYESSLVSNQAYGDWLRAKEAGDFALYRDIFEKLIDFERKSIDLRDEKSENYYNTCLGDYEKGMDIEKLDAFFGALKARIVPLLKRIVEKGKAIREDFLSRPCPIPQQEAFSQYLLKLQGLRETALVLATTEHPFTTSFGPTDVRVTTHYYEDLFISNIFSTLHEGGHALFMQNEPDELYENHAAGFMSMAMHETISRFYENLIGRSREFVEFVYPKLIELSGDTFRDVSAQELYEAVNIARPSLKRIEADELSYCLHIMVRYEIEQLFINGEITVDEIPALWNKKYKEYFGLDVPDDGAGCLQDLHWTGMFGYFPSYALGNAYGAQILAAMKKEVDFEGCLSKGDLLTILSWLKEKVFARASLLTPEQWIREITGEELNVNYYLDYLEEKFTALYGLK